MVGLNAVPLVAQAQDKPAADAPAAKADEKKGAAPAKDEKPEEKKDEAKPAPTPNKGDTAWMLTSTALVLCMSVPALALFYGGLVRAKNMLSMLMQVFVTFSLVTVLWCIYGYSLAFTEGNAYLLAASTGCSWAGRSIPQRASSRWRPPSARRRRSTSWCSSRSRRRSPRSPAA